MDLAGGVQAVEQRHHDVEDRHVRRPLSHEDDGFPPVGRLPHDLEAGTGQEQAQRLANNDVIVGQHQAQRHV